MILYFLDRQNNVLGQVSNMLARGMYITDDSKEDDIETGETSLEFWLNYQPGKREEAERYADTGNTILNGDGVAETYTIVDIEHDWFSQTIRVYAESVSLDLLNMDLEEFPLPSSGQTLAWYFNTFFGATSWSLGTNELAGKKKKLEFEEQNGTARLQSLVTAFGGEIGYSFTFGKTSVEARYVNVYVRRGDTGTYKHLKLREHITSFLVKKSIADLATAIKGIGNDGLNLKSMTYDDGDMYLRNGVLYSRSALAEYGVNGADIKRTKNFDTDNKSKLLSMVRRQLKKDKVPHIEYDAKTAVGFLDLSIGEDVIIQDLSGGTAYQTRVVNVIRHEDADMLDVTFGVYFDLLEDYDEA